MGPTTRSKGTNDCEDSATKTKGRRAKSKPSRLINTRLESEIGNQLVESAVKSGESSLDLEASQLEDSTKLLIEENMRKKNWKVQKRPTVKQPSPPLVVKGIPRLDRSFVLSTEKSETFKNEATAKEENCAENYIPENIPSEETQGEQEKMETEEQSNISVEIANIGPLEGTDLHNEAMETNESLEEKSYNNDLQVQKEIQTAKDNVEREYERITNQLEYMENAANSPPTFDQTENHAVEKEAPVIIGPSVPPKEFFDSVQANREQTEVNSATTSLLEDVESRDLNKDAATNSISVMEAHSVKNLKEVVVENKEKSLVSDSERNVGLNLNKIVQNPKQPGPENLLQVQCETKDLCLQKSICDQVPKEKIISIKVVKKTKLKAKAASSLVKAVNSKPNLTNEMQQLVPPVNDKPKVIAAHVEYISEYSSDDRKRKVLSKKSQEAKFVIKNETTSNVIHSPDPVSQPQENQIVPFPQPMLVDPAQLERETEQYYKEVSNVSVTATSRSSKAKPKCLTPYQIAKIAKNAAYGDDEASRETQAAWSTLHQYWTHVQENPYDFDGWTYLLNHVESMNNIEAARSAFEGFLPLYPYCFAYWNKLAELELKFFDLEQSLGILISGAKSVPFCTDLWSNLLKKFEDYAAKENVSDDTVRGLYEFAIDNTGLSWHSTPIWDLYIDYERKREDLVRVLHLHRRLLAIPTKLYSKNWDQILTLVRDHHPRNFLSVGEYFRLKKRVCEFLKVTFTPPPMVPPKHLLKVTQPEDNVLATMKEIIVANLIPIHEANEIEVNKRWKYEEKIKRPYFHVKPLERKQLKTWKEYLDFEIKEGDPVRICSLFERCLVPCAQYEEFWQRYSSYMEEHVLNVVNSKYSGISYKPGLFSSDKISVNSSDKVTSNIPGDDTKEPPVTKSKTDKLLELGEKYSISMPMSVNSKSDAEESIGIGDVSELDLWDSDDKKDVGVTREIKFEVTFLFNRLCEGISVGGRVLTPPSLTPSSLLQGVTWEDVRQIYRRGAWIHCPSKPLLLMQWAEFEESQGHVQTARELLNTVLAKTPTLLKARFHLIDLERRNAQYDRVEELYVQTFAAFKEPRIKSCIAIRYARFLFKIKEEDEKALLILRKAMKKDKSNIHLYHHVFDVCYQRRPIDCDGVLAAVMLALAAKDMSLEEKNWFCIKRSDFLREHGTIAQLKVAQVEEKEIKRKFELEKAEKMKTDPPPTPVKKDSDKINDSKEVEVPEDKKKAMNSQKTEINLPPSSGKIPTDSSLKVTSLPEPPKLLKDLMNPPINNEHEGKEKRTRKRSKSPRHHRKSSKRSRSSRKDRADSREKGEIREKDEIREHRRRSKKSKDHEHDRHSSSNSKQTKDTSSAFQEILYAPDGTVLYNPNEDKPAVSDSVIQHIPDPNAPNPQMLGYTIPGQMMPNYPNYPDQHMQGYPNQQNYQNNMQSVQSGTNDGKSYHAMPPTWDLDSTSLPNYGYGSSSSVVKDNQNNMYNQYYNLLNQGYKNKDKEEPNPYQNINLQDMAVNIPGRNPNTYLPPPPIPQGILGDSLFNQGSVSNMNRPFGRGDLVKQNFDHSNRPPFSSQAMNPSGSANQFGRQENFSTPYHMAAPPPLMSIPFHIKGQPPMLQNKFQDNIHPHKVDDNLVNQAPPLMSHLQSDPNFVSSSLSPAINMNVVPSLTVQSSHAGHLKGNDFNEDNITIPNRSALNVSAMLKEQRSKGSSEHFDSIHEESKASPVRSSYNEQDRRHTENSSKRDDAMDTRKNIYGEQDLRQSENFTKLEDEQRDTRRNSYNEPDKKSAEISPALEDVTKVVSSGRNTINVQALMKERMQSENSSNKVDEPLIVSSGRNTINVKALLKDRIAGERPSTERAPPERIPTENVSSGEEEITNTKVVSSGRNTINVMSFIKDRRMSDAIDSSKSQKEDTPVVSSGRNTINVKSMLEQKETNKGDEGVDNDDDIKIVSSGRNTINVMALMKDRKLPSVAKSLPHDEPKKKEEIRVGARRNKSKSRLRNHGQINAEKAPLLDIVGTKGPTGLMGQSPMMSFAIGGPDFAFNMGGINNQLPPVISKLSSQNLGYNIPEWIIKEGGELRLSSTQNGISLLRYWPRYMNEQGHKTLFTSLRKTIKWFQRRYKPEVLPVKAGDGWAILPKLIAWVGPCDFEKEGIILNANTNWPPEIVDLLHRLNHFSNSSFNSCFVSLYTNGYAHHPWHSENHTALEKNPTIATISLGVTRTLEMRNIHGPEQIKLPLFPGSLFVLEGAAVDDWQCQISKEPDVVSERISLAFRTMLMIKGVTV